MGLEAMNKTFNERYITYERNSIVNRVRRDDWAAE